ncbi:hypothetical protein MKY98_26850 [Paenibacillus sp. FSL M8-0228]|jgi:small basic protein|uniref:hypothetical protein n=1 Tax=Paenibacillus TaxID=44249 RepID=UPI00083CB2F8|nr:hypothetical protein [Paenibacillus polymyxa]MBO3287547.1 hypothetical protein [Paenibacillus polymyxa]ODB54958.1 hypothetical protein A7311_21010 [Paenibacillus polymyxa]
MSLGGLVDWLSEEGKHAIFIAGIVFAIVLAFRRQFIGAIGTFLVLLVAYAFVAKPELFGTISEFITSKLNLGGK